jgi:hypothetical protein
MLFSTTLFFENNEDIMDANAILARAKQDAAMPEGWIIFPLLRRKVIAGLLGWAFGIVMGLGLFVAIATAVIPANYQHGIAQAVITTILLGIFLFVGLGSAWTFVQDMLRLRHADEHIIVITPEDFVKQEGKKVIHVPLLEVRHVTARGVPPPDRDNLQDHATVRDVAGIGDNVAAFLVGRNVSGTGQRWMRNRRRTPTSLAFVDTRTDNEVTVVQDNAYGDPFLIAAYLKQYASTVLH